MGSDVKRFKAGDEVYCRPAHYYIGRFAEFIAVHENEPVVHFKIMLIFKLLIFLLNIFLLMYCMTVIDVIFVKILVLKPSNDLA
ncbi:hypothetical protein DRF65_25735 [Chryseobacterium pennae]|uniref:Uncharacterized protein n=1 Tax=Chryseobacterium pennae TaxID=2258962 RepID=A0A3D9C1S5_9FLAO|nr:hypothetical protein DRF65_25735 [Chryseobacterium pennae]